MVPQTRTMAPGRVTLVRVVAWCYIQEMLLRVNAGRSQVYQEGKTMEAARCLERMTMTRRKRVESRAHLEYNVSRMQRAQVSERRSGDHWSRGSPQKLKMCTGNTRKRNDAYETRHSKSESGFVLPETQSCSQRCFHSRDNRVFVLDTRTFGTAVRFPEAEENSSKEAVQNRPNS